MQAQPDDQCFLQKSKALFPQTEAAQCQGTLFGERNADWILCPICSFGP